MNAPKLTKAQVRLLSAAKAHHDERGLPLAHRQVAVASALDAKGLGQTIVSECFCRYFILTEAGRAALAALEAKR